MAVKLGYGGLANTNGARTFAGKEEAEIVVGGELRLARYMHVRGTRVYRPWLSVIALLFTRL